MKNRRVIGLMAGLIVMAGTIATTLQELGGEGQLCLGFSLLAIAWWATNVTHPGYTSLLLLGSFVLFHIAPKSIVFNVWTTPIVYLVVSGYGDYHPNLHSSSCRFSCEPFIYCPYVLRSFVFSLLR